MLVSGVSKDFRRSTVSECLFWIPMGNHAKVVFAVKNPKDCDAESNGDDWTCQTIETRTLCLQRSTDPLIYNPIQLLPPPLLRTTRYTNPPWTHTSRRGADTVSAVGGCDRDVPRSRVPVSFRRHYTFVRRSAVISFIALCLSGLKTFSSRESGVYWLNGVLNADAE
jgi:hypothetical protein